MVTRPARQFDSKVAATTVGKTSGNKITPCQKFSISSRTATVMAAQIKPISTSSAKTRLLIDKKLNSQVQGLKETKNLSITEIAKVTGRGRTTIYKALKEELNYIPYNRLVKVTKGETN